MQRRESKIKHNIIDLHYHQFGSGAEIFIAFHGFGQTGASFKEIAEALGEEVTLYSFDLPFHGSSEWKAGEHPLSKNEWEEILRKFLVEKAIKKFSLMGFSLGGKLALVAIERFPTYIERVILIAPDGIKTNFWYALATYPTVLRRYFKSLIVKPGSFFKTLAVFNRLRLMDKGVIKFALSQMDTAKNRRKVYYTWVVFRKLNIDLKSLTAVINAYRIPIYLYLGAYDKIITQAKINRFYKDVKIKEVKIIKSGHNSLLRKVANDLKPL